MHFSSFPCNGFMYAGITEGFSFDSEDEANKMPTASTRQIDQNEVMKSKPMEKQNEKSRKHLYSPETPSVIQCSSMKS